jgi:uncharacterized membrane protein
MPEQRVAELEKSQENVRLASATERNIESVASLERRFLDERTWLDKLADAIGGFSGSIYFVLLHIVGLAAWFLINTGHFFGVREFDPFPFILLAMVVSVEAVLLSTFVLMKQNRMAQRADERDHLNLQIDLLAEEEITKMLQMQRLICRQLGINEVLEDPVAEEMSQSTSVNRLAEQLREKLPKEPAA